MRPDLFSSQFSRQSTITWTYWLTLITRFITFVRGPSERIYSQSPLIIVKYTRIIQLLLLCVLGAFDTRNTTETHENNTSNANPIRIRVHNWTTMAQTGVRLGPDVRENIQKRTQTHTRMSVVFTWLKRGSESVSNLRYARRAMATDWMGVQATKRARMRHATVAVCWMFCLYSSNGQFLANEAFGCIGECGAMTSVCERERLCVNVWVTVRSVNNKRTEF